MTNNVATVQTERRSRSHRVIAVAALAAVLASPLAIAVASESRRTPQVLVADGSRPITAADGYHGVGVRVCRDGHRLVRVADAYHGIGLAVCI